MDPVELKRWRDAMISDPGDVLINAYKRWVGPIRTPFNKHDLIARLEAYLRKPATKDLIVGLLAWEDRLVVAVLHYGGDMDCPALERFVDGRIARGQPVRTHIQILRERMIIYAYRDVTGRELLSIVPALRADLDQVLRPNDLIGNGEVCHPGDDNYGGNPSDGSRPAEAQGFGGDPFAAFCSLVSCGVHFHPAFKSQGVPGKKAEAMLARTAPGLVPGGETLKAAISALTRAGVFTVTEKGKLLADPVSYTELCASAGALAPACLLLAGSDLPCSLSFAASGLIAVLTGLPAGLGLVPTAMERIAGILLIRHGGSGGDRAEVFEAGTAFELARLILKQLILAGLVLPLIQGHLVLSDKAGAFLRLCAPDPAGDRQKPVLVVEASHEIRVLPEAGPEVRAWVASMARLESTGTVWTAILDRPAARVAFSFGLSAETLASFLERYSGRPLPQGFRFSLEAWESEARAIRVRTGIVVVLDGHLASMLDHAPEVKSLVREKLGEGVYLLAAGDLESAGKALATAGLPVDLRGEILAAQRSRAGLSGLQGLTDAPKWGDPGEAQVSRFSLGDNHKPLEFSLDSCKLDKESMELLNPLLSRIDSWNLSEKARSELADRVRARLILTEDQLDAAARAGGGGGETSAGALDYQAKVRLIDAALRSGFVIELVWMDETGQRCETRGVPVDVRRSPGLDLVSVMDHRGHSVVSLPLGAVTWIRRIPSS